jgi:hypothetical protein
MTTPAGCHNQFSEGTRKSLPRLSGCSGRSGRGLVRNHFRLDSASLAFIHRRRCPTRTTRRLQNRCSIQRSAAGVGFRAGHSEMTIGATSYCRFLDRQLSSMTVTRIQTHPSHRLQVSENDRRIASAFSALAYFDRIKPVLTPSRHGIPTQRSFRCPRAYGTSAIVRCFSG